MELLLPPIDQFQAFLICLARIAGFMSAVPVLYGRQTPAQLKVGLTILISLILFPIMGPKFPVIPFEAFPFALFVVNETLLGILLGMIARFIFTSVQFGGRIIGFQMGFAMANVMDPQMGEQSSLISQFQNVFAIFIFLALDGHHIFLQAAVRSYEYLPPGNLNFSGEAIPYLVELSSKMFVLGIQFSVPIIVLLLLSSLSLGLMSRIFPQLNVFLLSFPLNISISFIVIGLTLSMTYIILRREFDDLPNRILSMLQYLN